MGWMNRRRDRCSTACMMKKNAVNRQVANLAEMIAAAVTAACLVCESPRHFSITASPDSRQSVLASVKGRGEVRTEF